MVWIPMPWARSSATTKSQDTVVAMVMVETASAATDLVRPLRGGQKDANAESEHSADDATAQASNSMGVDLMAAALAAAASSRSEEGQPDDAASPESRSTTTSAGKIGLRNLGNTCFMSAGLQCLTHLEPLAFYFLSGEYKSQVRSSGPGANSAGELANAFADLQRALWHSGAAVQDPSELHAKLSKMAPYLFEGRDQQDVQEFLTFCLDGLHEDLNIASARPKVEGVDEAADEDTITSEYGEEFGAAFAWLKHLERNKSFLVDLLQGQLRSTLKCKRCKHQSRRFDPFLYLSLPVTRSFTSVTDCLKEFLKEETLVGGEQWRCDKCSMNVDASKKIDVWKLPPVLVLHLKRFEFDAKLGEYRKIDTAFSCPPRLDLSSFCSSPQKEGAEYEVACVANHIGSCGQGHYTATCRVPATGSSSRRARLRRGEVVSAKDEPSSLWHYFDDERVTPLGPDDQVVGSDAYVIFLIRCPQAHTELSPRRQSIASPEFWPHQLSSQNSVIADVIPGRAGAFAAAAHRNPRSSILWSGALQDANPRSAQLDESLSRERNKLAREEDRFGIKC